MEKVFEVFFFGIVRGLKTCWLELRLGAAGWGYGAIPKNREFKLEMLGSIVWRLASPRKILGENFFEHSG